VQIYRSLIKSGEGSIPHMYLDTVGKVTVGVGNMLPDIKSSLLLPFRVDDSPAEQVDIQKDFSNVLALSKGKYAGFYGQYTKCRLSTDAINALLDERLQEFEGYLKTSFADFDNFPEKVKKGLMDMIFNLGYSGLKNKFPNFMKHALAQNWQGCADECKRKGIRDKRNEEVKALFESCKINS
jgi:GH24 family phage-related lysozyme (muramidase)